MEFGIPTFIKVKELRLSIVLLIRSENVTVILLEVNEVIDLILAGVCE